MQPLTQGVPITGSSILRLSNLLLLLSSWELSHIFFFSNLPPSSVLELSLHWVGDAGGGLYEMQHPSEMYAHPLILRSYAVISVWKRQ